MTTPTSGQVFSPQLVIAFDADDTLWHNEIYYRRATEKFKEFVGGGRDPSEIERALMEIEVRNIQWFGYGFKSFTLSMVETAMTLTNGAVPAETLRNILDLGKSMLDSDVLLFEHARATLAKLAPDYDLMLITKGDLVEQQNKLTRSGLGVYFTYTEIVPEKTTQIYQAILDRYDISPRRFVMVGNALKSDILPVLSLGGKAVLVPYEHTWTHENVEADPRTYHQVEHLGLVPDVIAELEAELAAP